MPSAVGRTGRVYRSVDVCSDGPVRLAGTTRARLAPLPTAADQRDGRHLRLAPEPEPRDAPGSAGPHSLTERKAPPVRVVVVADDLLVRAGLCAILVTSPGLTVCGEAGDLAGCRSVVDRVGPDVVLVDSRTPALDDLTVARELVADGRGPRVVVLTAPPPDDTVVAALRAGASGVLLKDAGPQQIAQTLTIVSRGDAFIDPVLVRVVIEYAVTHEAAPERGPDLGATTDRLTPAERDVLVRVADGRSNREIGRELHLSEGAVKAHINRMFPKLGVENRVQAAVLAYRAGLHRPAR